MGQQTTTQYEVYCRQCRVSFPVGTRVCMHCGGRTGQRPAAGDPDTTPQEHGPPPPELFPMFETESPQPIGEDSEEETPGRSPSRIVMGVVWVLVAIVGSIYRVCSGG